MQEREKYFLLFEQNVVTALPINEKTAAGPVAGLEKAVRRHSGKGMKKAPGAVLQGLFFEPFSR